MSLAVNKFFSKAIKEAIETVFSKEFFKFIIVGSACTSVDLIIYTVLHVFLNMQRDSSKAVGTLCAFFFPIYCPRIGRLKARRINEILFYLS